MKMKKTVIGVASKPAMSKPSMGSVGMAQKKAAASPMGGMAKAGGMKKKPKPMVNPKMYK